MVKWISAGRGKHGLRYREHETETIGISRNKRPLRYYVAQYKFNGKACSDTYGWESDFDGGVAKIESLALQFKINRKAMIPPFSYKEMIADLQDTAQAEEQAKLDAEQQQVQSDKLKFDNMFDEYCCFNDHKVSLESEKGYYKNWIKAEIGDMRLDEIELLDLMRIRKKMVKANRAPRTIAYIKSIIRQVYHHALKTRQYKGSVPTQFFLEKQKLNNERDRYLSPDEAENLLNKIALKSEKTYRLTLLALHTGMRFGEMTKLLWQHVDEIAGTIKVVDPKNNTNRTVYMNRDIQDMFKGLRASLDADATAQDKLVFPSRMASNKMKPMTQISNAFNRAVAELKLNEGVTDRRYKVVFHTLRHTCASWLANREEELQVIGKVLGQKSLVSAQRYSHINDASVKRAVNKLAEEARRTTGKKIINFRK